jgi:hypothetical protein
MSGFLIADCALKSCPQNLPVVLKIVPKVGYECILEKIDQ